MEIIQLNLMVDYLHMILPASTRISYSLLILEIGAEVRIPRRINAWYIGPCLKVVILICCLHNSNFISVYKRMQNLDRNYTGDTEERVLQSKLRILVYRILQNIIGKDQILLILVSNTMHG